MSRFRPEERDRPPESIAVPPSQPAVNLVPVSAEDFARARRQKILKWGSVAAIVAMLIFAYLYRQSMPVDALNQYQDAKKFYDSGKYADALLAVNRAVPDRSQRLNALRLRANIYRAIHQPKDAVDDMTKVIAIEPSAAADHQFRAEEYLELDDPASAAKDYGRIVELNQSADAYNGRGLCYLKLNQTQKAIGDFSHAIEREPKVEFYLQRGLAYSALGDSRKAIADFDEGARLRPGFSAVYRARAVEKNKIGDTAGAERDRETAYQMEKPDRPPLQQVELPQQ